MSPLSLSLSLSLNRDSLGNMGVYRPRADIIIQTQIQKSQEVSVSLVGGHDALFVYWGPHQRGETGTW